MAQSRFEFASQRIPLPRYSWHLLSIRSLREQDCNLYSFSPKLSNGGTVGLICKSLVLQEGRRLRGRSSGREIYAAQAHEPLKDNWVVSMLKMFPLFCLRIYGNSNDAFGSHEPYDPHSNSPFHISPCLLSNDEPNHHITTASSSPYLPRGTNTHIPRFSAFTRSPQCTLPNAVFKVQFSTATWSPWLSISTRNNIKPIVEFLNITGIHHTHHYHTEMNLFIVSILLFISVDASYRQKRACLPKKPFLAEPRKYEPKKESY